MKCRTLSTLVLVAAGALIGWCVVASAPSASAEPIINPIYPQPPQLPARPLNLQPYTGTLDPVFWRAVPAFGPLTYLDKWAMLKPGRAPLIVDMTPVETLANNLANRRVTVYGKYRTEVRNGQTINFMKVYAIVPAPVDLRSTIP